MSAAFLNGLGATDFTYAWQGLPDAGRIAAHLAAGTYTCTVTNIHTGCSAVGGGTLTAPAPIVVTEIMAKHRNPKCHGDATGKALVGSTGGTGGRVYVWSNDPDSSHVWLLNAVAGTYHVTATDVNGCTGEATVVITEPPALEITSVAVQALAGANLGKYKATVTASGGTGTLKYSKNGTNYGTNKVFTLLPAGSYTFYARDANLCVDAYPITIGASASADDRGDILAGEEPETEIPKSGIELLLSPNPAADALNVELTEGVGLNGALVITDVLGRMVLRKNMQLEKGEKLTIRLEQLSSGTYNLQYAGKDGVLLNKRFDVER